MGIALTSCTVPAAGTPTFEIGEDELEFGVGIHGEPGRRRVSMMSADELASALIDAIADSIEPTSDDRLLLIVNGMGGTPLLELYLLYDAVSRVCTDKGLQIVRSLVGNYCTSLEWLALPSR